MACTAEILTAAGEKVCLDGFVEDGSLSLSTLNGELAKLWLIVCGGFVFYMHLGFSMLEAGCVSKRNVQNILLKNVMNICIGTIVWFLFGYGVAYGGSGSDGKFIGEKSYFGKYGKGDDITWFFQWAFCVTASTIVSGAVAERMKLSAFFIACVAITGFIYPVVVHWIWDSEGWLNAFEETNDTPLFDFAGSGVVHMVGGFCAFMGAWLTGERPGRFDATNPVIYGNHSVPFQLFGTITLWFGWYGFNCGSTLEVAGQMETAARVAVTTTISAAAGGLVTVSWAKLINGKWSIGMSCNGILAGLVSITSPCPVVEPWMALIIGLIGGSIYFGSSNLMLKLKIDDPLDAASVHGFCGIWGLLAAGIFAKEELVRAVYGPVIADKEWGPQLGVQVLGVVCILAWACGTSGFLFKILDLTLGLRTEEGGQKGGLDADEFGMPAYATTPVDEVEVSTSSVAKQVGTEAVELAGKDKDAPAV